MGMSDEIFFKKKHLVRQHLMSSSCLKMGKTTNLGGVLPSGKHTKNDEQSPF